MDTALFIAFIGVSVAVIVIPGPSILLILSNSLQQGRRAGLSSVAGISAAMAVQLLIVLVGLTSVFASIRQALVVLRWAGIAYLLYLGVQRWRSYEPGGYFEAASSRQYRSAFVEGCIVALTNPTTLLFFIAFFPQFLDADRDPAIQLVTMSATFWLLALVADIAYALLAARIGRTLREHQWVRLRNRLSGIIMVLAAIGRALAGAAP